MAGDWIKMQVGLWDAPEVVRMVSALNADKATVCGALFRAWSLVDQYTEDGRLVGYTPAALEENVGVAGLCEAMQQAGWLIIEADTLIFPKFDRHNGQSAKRRAQERDRKQRVRNVSASDADKKRPREDKRERREQVEAEKTLTSDDDGALFSLEEKRGDVFHWVEHIREVIPRKCANDWSLICKVAVLVVLGQLSEDDVNQSLEAVKLKGRNKPAAYFHKCLTNKAADFGADFNAMLAAINVPFWLNSHRTGG